MSDSTPFYAPGLYLCRVTEHGFETSKNGNPMIVFRMLPEYVIRTVAGFDGELKEESTPTDQQWSRTSRLVIVPDNQNSIDFAMAKLRYAGFDGERFEELNLDGAVVRFLCEHKPFEGRLYENWSLPLPPRDNAPLATDGDTVKKLNALFGRKLKDKTASAASLPEPPTPRAQGVSVGDDDIPF